MARRHILKPKDFTFTTHYFILLLFGLLLQVTQSFDCVNGVFDGVSCTCDPCWTGLNCDLPAFKSPQFVERFKDVAIKANSQQKLFKANAQDTCTGTDTDKCPCGKLLYTIESGGEYFNIDQFTGEVEVKPGVLLSEDEYTLLITAKNENGPAEQSDTMTVSVHVLKTDPFTPMSDGYGEGDEQQHSRQKRATNVVTNVTFHLEKKEPHNDTTEMKVGTKIGFRLTIHFPPGETDMLVELFTPDNASTVMMLCEVEVNALPAGTNLHFNGSGTPNYFSLNQSIFYDRAVIDFGLVTNDNTDSSNAINSQIIIEYSAVMIENEATKNGSTYWVSAGAEYSNDEYVWVGQARFMALLDDENYTEVPTFNFTGPSTMAIGSAAVFQVDMFIPYPSVFLSFEAFAPINTSNVMSVCGIKAKDTAVNYECGFDYKSLEADMQTDGQTRGFKRAHLEIGVVTNKGVRDSAYVESDSRITVEFIAHLYGDMAVLNQVYWVGAALQIGGDQIWAGQIAVTATTMVNDALSPTYAISGGNTLTTQTPAVVELTVTIPEHTTQDYELEVLTPYSNGAILQICALLIKSVGENMPCLQKNIEAIYSSQDGNGTSVPDRAVLHLGRVTNVGSWGWVNTAVNNSNDITFQILVKANNHSSASDGSEHNITIGFIQNGTKLNLGDRLLTVQAAPAIDTQIVNESVPTFSLKYGDVGSEYVEVGTATTFVYEMKTKRDVKYPMMDIEFIMPNDTAGDGKTPISICRTEIKSVGKNIVCLTKSVVNKAIVYDSRYHDKLNDRSILSLGAVCNSELIGGNDTTEDTLTIETIVQMQEHSTNTNGSRTWLSVGTMYSPTRMWVGQLAVYPRTNGYVATTKTPTIILNKNSSLTSTPVGYIVTYNLVIKSPPGEHFKYEINITSNDIDLSICVFRLVAVGYNLPCVKTTTPAQYDHDEVHGVNTKASINLGFVSNVGTTALSSDAMFDDNTLQFQIVLQVIKTASVAQKSFAVLVTHSGGSKSLSDTVDVTADTSAITTPLTNVSTLEFNMGTITEGESPSNLVTPGQAKRLLVDIRMPEDVTQDITVKVLAPLNLNGIVEIPYISILSVGANMPCLQRKVTVADYIARNTTSGKTEIASLSLGYVCNIRLAPNDADANLIRIQAIVKLMKDDSLSEGQTLTLSASVNTNDQLIFIAQLDLQVTKTFTEIRQDNMTLINNTGIKLNISDDPIHMKISERRVFPVLLYIPTNSTLDVKFDVDLPVNDSAVITFLGLRVQGSGKNLVGYGKYNDVEITQKSTQNTTQINKVYCSLGIVTNTGYTYQTGEEQDEDNTVVLELELQLADSVINSNNSEHWISLGIKVGIYIVILEHKVVVIRDGMEKPQIEFVGSVNANSTSSEVEIDAVIRHSNTSTAEGQNGTAILYYPSFMNFSAITWVNDSRIPYTDSVDGNSLHIQLEKLYFTDVLSFTLVLKTNGKKVPAGITGSNVVSNLEAAFKMHDYLSTDDFVGEMSELVYSVTVVPKTNFQCVTTALGMETGAIQDCQLDASAETIPGGEAKLGRIGSSGWKPFVRDGKLKEGRYYQVYFGNATLVQKIDMEVSPSTNLVTKIMTKFSNDGFAWIDGEIITIATPYSVPAKHTQTLSSSDPYRYIRVYILNNQTPRGEIAIKFEFYGCMVDDVSTTDVCTSVRTPSRVPHADFNRRGFLALTDGTLFVCDAALDRGLKQVCFRSTDGNVWKELDSRLACMVGHDADNNRVYGMATDGVSFMVSSDNGASWKSCHVDDVTKSKAKLGFIPVKVVPWKDDSNLKMTNPSPGYTVANWGATVRGIHKYSGSVWTTKMDWSTCCP
ncbi:uncharacterized protein LOC121368242 [Gigantopelta aegis]|uniref:uncharacterized protein LOC121368242 n=1 Tax=Gigantopelta aegis TaxID=1735272 RepID=UPI001B8889E5|nr:uncharacterized protein LOC121368242 [Gigantopelta aegis]